MIKQISPIFFISLLFGGCFSPKKTQTTEQNKTVLDSQIASTANTTIEQKNHILQSTDPNKANPSKTIDLIDGATTNMDSIFWIERIHQFGDVPSGPPATTKFVFINKGNKPVSISEVQAGCSCTATDYTKGLISPNDTGFVSASYKTANTFGFFRKHIDVFFDHQDKKHHLILTGNVDPMRTK